MVKLWLDDAPERDPIMGWDIVRTADEAIEFIQNHDVDVVSLDHDLGDVHYLPYPIEITGMAVVDWMVKNKRFPKLVSVHSMNTPCANRMVSRLRDAGANVVRLSIREAQGL
jgi:hypothetical protein